MTTYTVCMKTSVLIMVFQPTVKTSTVRSIRVGVNSSVVVSLLHIAASDACISRPMSIASVIVSRMRVFAMIPRSFVRTALRTVTFMFTCGDSTPATSFESFYGINKKTHQSVTTTITKMKTIS